MVQLRIKNKCSFKAGFESRLNLIFVCDQHFACTTKMYINFVFSLVLDIRNRNGYRQRNAMQVGGVFQLAFNINTTSAQASRIHNFFRNSEY